MLYIHCKKSRQHCLSCQGMWHLKFLEIWSFLMWFGMRKCCLACYVHHSLAWFCHFNGGGKQCCLAFFKPGCVDLKLWNFFSQFFWYLLKLHMAYFHQQFEIFGSIRTQKAWLRTDGSLPVVALCFYIRCFVELCRLLC